MSVCNIGGELMVEVFGMRLSTEHYARLYATKMLSTKEVQRLVIQLQKDVNDGVYDDVRDSPSSSKDT